MDEKAKELLDKISRELPTRQTKPQWGVDDLWHYVGQLHEAIRDHDGDSPFKPGVAELMEIGEAIIRLGLFETWPRSCSSTRARTIRLLEELAERRRAEAETPREDEGQCHGERNGLCQTHGLCEHNRRTVREPDREIVMVFEDLPPGLDGSIATDKDGTVVGHWTEQPGAEFHLHIGQFENFTEKDRKQQAEKDAEGEQEDKLGLDEEESWAAGPSSQLPSTGGPGVRLRPAEGGEVPQGSSSPVHAGETWTADRSRE